MATDPIFPFGDLNPQLLLRSRDWDSWLAGLPFAGSPFAGLAFDRGGAWPDPAVPVDGSRPLRDDRASLTDSGSGGRSAPEAAAQVGALTEYWAGSANGTAGYDIVIGFTGSGWTSDLETPFIMAADYFTTVITADIGGDAVAGGQPIDDLYITAELTSIDGVGGTLGQAGPTETWAATELPSIGQMQFDTADAQSYLDQGLWDDVVTHEMMHVLGFGTLWDYSRNPLVVQSPDPNGSDLYVGPFGNTVFKALFPDAPFLPVESDGGSGTAGSHWDEQALGNELMTGYINESNILSPFSVMSLADLGYSVQFQPYYGNSVA